LSRGLQRLNGLYAQQFNIRHGRTGHLFGGRFHAWLLDDEDYFEETCRYVVSNPVRAGLCRQPSDWPWSATRLGERPADGASLREPNGSENEQVFV
jgi:putative transposase